MKSVEVKRQHRPPLRRCVELVLSGVKYRLFRAAITVGIIALATAFLMTMLSESVITRRVADALEAEVAPRKMLQFWVGRLAEPPNLAELSGTIARAERGGPRWNEMRAWAELNDEQLGQLHDVARRQQTYLTFFTQMTEARRRRALNGTRHSGPRMFGALIDHEASDADTARLNEDALKRMTDYLSEIGKPLPTSLDAFEGFLRDWWTTRAWRERVIAGHAEAIETLNQPGRLLHEREPLDVLATTDADALHAALSADAVGFRIQREDLQTVQREAAYAHDAQRIEAALNSSLLKARLAERRNIEPHEVNARSLLEEVSSSSGADWLVSLTDKARGLGGASLSTERIHQAALTETDKAAVTVEAARRGRLAKIVAGAGQTVAVHEPVAYLSESDAGVEAYLESLEADAARQAARPENVVPVVMTKVNTMSKGTIISWHAAEGDTVEPGQILFEMLPDTPPATDTAKTFRRWILRLCKPLTADQVAERFTSGSLGDAERREYRNWGELTDAQMTLLVKLPARTQSYLDFLASMTPEQHLDNYGAFPAADPAAALREALREQGVTLPLPGWMAQHVRFAERWLGAAVPQEAGYRLFEHYLDDRRRAPALHARIAAGHAEAIAALRGDAASDEPALLAERSPVDLLAAADEKAQAALARAEFHMGDKDLRKIQEHVGLKRDAERLRTLVTAPLLREELAKHRNDLSEDDVTADALMRVATDKAEAEWVNDLLGKVASLKPLGLTAERVEQVAERQLAARELAETEAEVSALTVKTGFMGFSARTIWLLVVSFIVCVVGIANAMLMSVTERFREIATMKCLGATDGFIMINFVLESCLQGVAGSIIGLVLGLVLGILRTALQYGTTALQQLPAVDLLATAGLSFVIGVVISALAAVYPAWVAARLAPMEAMRIE
ncbi:MAG: FtsX-like permease family protein [Phycisphaerae bacterium]|nr:FtsX-like permease family protein [Phycisphaerae bacterium]